MKNEYVNFGGARFVDTREWHHDDDVHAPINESLTAQMAGKAELPHLHLRLPEGFSARLGRSTYRESW